MAQVLFHCDNSAAVKALSSRTAHDPIMTHLLQCLFFLQAHFKFELSASYIPGKQNKAADTLSRNHRLSVFLSLYPQAHTSPSTLPQALLNLILVPPPPWTSSRWAQLFRNILQEV